MFCWEQEWNISFAGCGFRSIYHIGAMSCVQERAPRLIQGASKICGASSGCLVAVALTVGIPVGESGSELLKTCRYFLKKNSTPEDICSFVSSVCKSCDCFVHCYNTLYANIGVFFFSFETLVCVVELFL